MKIKNKKMFAFVTGSTGILLLSVAWPSKKFESTPLLEPARSSFVHAADRDEAALQEQLVAQRARSKNLAWGRDPFKAPGSPQATHPELTRPPVALGLTLTGTCVVDGEPMGIINREIVEVGDRLASGHTVNAIGSNTVVLLLDGEEQTLRLGDER